MLENKGWGEKSEGGELTLQLPKSESETETPEQTASEGLNELQQESPLPKVYSPNQVTICKVMAEPWSYEEKQAESLEYSPHLGSLQDRELAVDVDIQSE